jgi:hypothetical protein
VKEKRTFTAPVAEANFPFSLPAMLKLWLPFFLFSIFHVLANVSSACAVSTSSQSFHLVVENDKVITGGSFNEATGIDSDVAFFVNEPVHHHSKS